MGEDTTEIRREIEQTRARMGETAEAIGYKADIPSRVRENVSDRIESVKGTITGGVRQAVGQAKETTGAAGQAARDKTSDTVSMAVENPLGLALAALALGFLGGMLVPVSDVERERLGPASEQIAQRAQTAATEAVEAGKSMMQETISNAAQSLQQHGQEIAQHAMSGTQSQQSEAQPQI
jgi:hypothetical protein